MQIGEYSDLCQGVNIKQDTQYTDVLYNSLQLGADLTYLHSVASVVVSHRSDEYFCRILASSSENIFLNFKNRFVWIYCKNNFRGFLKTKFNIFHSAIRVNILLFPHYVLYRTHCTVELHCWGPDSPQYICCTLHITPVSILYCDHRTPVLGCFNDVSKSVCSAE